MDNRVSQCEGPLVDNDGKMSENSNSISWKDIKYQILSSNVAFLFTIHAGVNLAFSNLLLNDVDKDTSSWFASMATIGTPIGAITCGILMDRFGRKGCNLMIAIPCIGSWLILSFVDKSQVSMLYVSRLLAGVAAGLTTSNMVYVSETSHKKYRSLFLTLVGVHFSFGILLTTLLKVVFRTWRESAIFYVFFFSLVTLLVCTLTPESPLWLVNFRSDFVSAKKSLKRLNDNTEIFEEEWRNLKRNARVTLDKEPATYIEDGDNDNNDKEDITRMKKGWYTPTVYKPFVTLLILILLQQLSGLYPIIFYAYDIFPQISPKIGQVLRNEAFVLFGIIRFVSSIVVCCLSTKVGRRKLLMFSSLSMSTISIALVVSCNNVNSEVHTFWEDFIEYTALICFITFVGVGAVGVMMIPWTLIVELMPTEKRATGGAILISYAYLVLFVVSKSFPYVLDLIGIKLAFGFFAFISFLIALFTHIYVPETLNRSLEEIQLFFSSQTEPKALSSPTITSRSCPYLHHSEDVDSNQTFPLEKQDL